MTLRGGIEGLNRVENGGIIRAVGQGKRSRFGKGAAWAGRGAAEFPVGGSERELEAARERLTGSGLRECLTEW
jgi:hypothetical protein